VLSTDHFNHKNSFCEAFAWTSEAKKLEPSGRSVYKRLQEAAFETKRLPDFHAGTVNGLKPTVANLPKKLSQDPAHGRGHTEICSKSGLESPQESVQLCSLGLG